MQLQVRKLPALAASGCLPLVGQGIQQFPEMQTVPFKDAFRRIAGAIEENDRVEITVTLNGRLAAFMVLVLEDDMHVGPCCTVQWAYVQPDHVGVGAVMYRRAVRIAKSLRVPWLAYTRRTGDGEYRLKYRRLHG